MPSYLTDTERYLLLPNPNYNESDFADEKRSQEIDAEAGIGAVFSPLKTSGHWKARQFAFDKARWASASSAEEWVREHRQAFKSFEPAPVRVECLEVAFPRRATGSTPTDAELEQIRQYMLEDIPADQLYVRTMRLTNDQWGKHNVRLSRGFQRSVIGTMPGRSLLLGHPETKQIAAEPIGRFFDAWVDRDANGVEWGYAKFYLVNTDQNAHARAQIDGGVWQYTSIGMETDWRECSICGLDIFDSHCPHIPGETYPSSAVKDLELNPQVSPDDPDQVICGLTYRGQGTAIEGSIVYLPELNGTQVVAETAFRQAYHSGDFGQAKAMMLSQAGTTDGEGREGSDQPGTQEPTADHITTEQEAEAMSEQVLKTLEAKAATLEAEKASLEAKLATATEALESLKADHAALKATQREAEPLIVAEKAFRAAAVAEVTRLATLVGREAELAAVQSMAGEDLAALPADKVLGLIDDWTKRLDTQDNSTGRQSTPGDTDAADTESVTVSHMALI